MKTIITLLVAITLATTTTAQDLPIKDGRLTYELTVDTVKLTKDQLYNNAKVWLNNTFNSSKAVIQTDDKEAGLVIGKGIIKSPYKAMLGQTVIMNWTILLSIRLKDGKYRLTVTEEDDLNRFFIQYNEGDKYAKRAFESYGTRVKDLLTDFQFAMNKQDDF